MLCVMDVTLSNHTEMCESSNSYSEHVFYFTEFRFLFQNKE